MLNPGNPYGSTQIWTSSVASRCSLHCWLPMVICPGRDPVHANTSLLVGVSLLPATVTYLLAHLIQWSPKQHTGNWHLARTGSGQVLKAYSWACHHQWYALATGSKCHKQASKHIYGTWGVGSSGGGPEEDAALPLGCNFFGVGEGVGRTELGGEGEDWVRSGAGWWQPLLLNPNMTCRLGSLILVSLALPPLKCGHRAKETYGCYSGVTWHKEANAPLPRGDLLRQQPKDPEVAILALQEPCAPPSLGLSC